MTSQDVVTYSYRIVRVFPHDRMAYTQGLAFDHGVLYEGTGLHGRSELREVALTSGGVIKAVKLPERFFGEGITVYGNRVVQLTWKSHIGFVYDRESLTLSDTFKYPTEGWGITHDGMRFIMSDGTSKLYFLNPKTFDMIGSIDPRGRDPPILLADVDSIHGPGC